MLAGIRDRLTYANVMATIAVFIALGGVAWAAATIDSKDVVDGSLKSIDLKDEKGVTGDDVVPDSLTGAGIDEDTLGQVGDADKLDGKDASEFASAGSEQWFALNLNGDTPAECFWEAFPSADGFNPPSFFRDRAGVVHLRGMIRARDGFFEPCDNNNGALISDNLSAIPGGYRPANREVLTISSADKPGRLDVTSLGRLILGAPGSYPSWADAKTWISLDGVSYRCGPSGENGCP